MTKKLLVFTLIVLTLVGGAVTLWATHGGNHAGDRVLFTGQDELDVPVLKKGGSTVLTVDDAVPGGGISALNGLVGPIQTLQPGSSGTDFTIQSSGNTHTFNLPTASTTNRGLMSSTQANQLPSVPEKAALAGSSGAPADTNRYVTEDDPAMTDSRTPTGTAGGHLAGSYPNPSVVNVVCTSCVSSPDVEDGSLTTTDLSPAAALTKGQVSDAGTWNEPEIPVLTNEKYPNAVLTDGSRLSSKLVLDDIDATPVADRQLQVKDGFVQAADTIGNEGRYIKKESLQEITGAEVANSSLTDVDLTAANKDGTAGTPSLRTLGTGAQQAAAGNDPRLSDARTPTAHAASHLPGGSDALDSTYATISYVDSVAQGLNPKDAAALATTANITLAGEQTIDGVLTSGSRVLVKNQTAAADNGLYLSAAGAWARTTDADTADDIERMHVVITGGSTQGSTSWTLATPPPITLGTTALSFVLFNTPAAVEGGDGLTKSGNTLHVGAGAGLSVAADTVGIAVGGVGTAQLADQAVNTTKLLNDTILNDDINSAAAIAKTKISSSGTWTAAEIPSLDTSKITTGTFGTARIPDLDAAKITTGVFDAARIPAGAVGEDNIATNVGSGGFGWFLQKVGVELQFRNLNVGSLKLALSNDVVNNEIDIDVVPNQFDLSTLGGSLNKSQVSPMGQWLEPDIPILSSAKYADALLTNGSRMASLLVLDDTHGSPIADRQVQVKQALLQCADTSGAEQRCISKNSVEQLQAGDLGFDPATQTELNTHTGAAAGAHAGSAISYAGGTGMSATNVEAAIDELATEKANVATAVMDGDTAGGVLSGTYPNPGFAADMATQAELDTVSTTTTNHLNDSSDAHASSAIGFTPTGTIGATNVQTAIAEVATEAQTYADAIAQGVAYKEKVRVATTVNITLSGEQTIDGELTSSSRVLVKNQTTASQNGIYVSAAGAWSRAADADTSAEVSKGMAVFVDEGTTYPTGNLDTTWVLVTDNPITLGTTALMFSIISQPASVQAGNGLTQDGSTLNVGAGSGITVGVDTVGIAAGGVGATELATNSVGTPHLNFPYVRTLTAGTNITLTNCAEAEGVNCTIGITGIAPPIVLDLADNGVNESTALAEVATTGDIHSIFTEPTVDKLLINVGANWPTADLAQNLSCTSCVSLGELDFNPATQAELDAHLTDATAAHAASAIAFTPTGSIAASDVQAAIAELAAEAFLVPELPTTQTLTAGTAINCGTGDRLRIARVIGSGGAVDLTVSPQIANGTVAGQLCIIAGTDDSATVALDDVAGDLRLAAAGQKITLNSRGRVAVYWDGTDWQLWGHLQDEAMTGGGGGEGGASQTCSTNCAVTAGVRDVLCDSTSGNVTITLPDASTYISGNILNPISVKKIESSTNTCSIAAASGDSFEGSPGPLSVAAPWAFYNLKPLNSNTWGNYGSL